MPHPRCTCETWREGCSGAFCRFPRCIWGRPWLVGAAPSRNGLWLDSLSLSDVQVRLPVRFRRRPQTLHSALQGFPPWGAAASQEMAGTYPTAHVSVIQLRRGRPSTSCRILAWARHPATAFPPTKRRFPAHQMAACSGLTGRELAAFDVYLAEHLRDKFSSRPNPARVGWIRCETSLLIGASARLPVTHIELEPSG